MENKEQRLEIFEGFVFTNIFKTFRMAIQPGKLVIAFFALAVICLAGWLMDLSNSVVVDGNGVSELQIYIHQPDRVAQFIEDHHGNGERTGVFVTVWYFAAARFKRATNSVFDIDLPSLVKNIADYFKAVCWAMRYHPVYCIIYGLIKLAIISIAGGSLCRISALQFARGEKPGMAEALRFGKQKFRSLFALPLVPAGIIIVIGLCIFVVGLIGNIPYAGELIIGISMPVILTAGAFIALCLMGMVAGFNLMFPAVAYENSGCYDAIGSCFHYVFSRPWRMFFYTLTATVYGSTCYIFVRFFAFLLLWVSHRFLQFGVLVNNSASGFNKLTEIWPGPTFTNFLGVSTESALNLPQLCAAGLVRLCVLIVVGLVVAFIISFYFTANTIIYALLRNKVDNIALDDIYD